MNDKLRSKVSLEFLTKVYDTYPNMNNFIEKFLEDVCSREHLPFDQLFLFSFIF